MNQKEYIQVWDILVRIFHYNKINQEELQYRSSLVRKYTISKPPVFMKFQVAADSGKYARFTDFIYPPKKAVQYIKELIQGSPQYYIGHNPAAGWMVIFLLIMLCIVCVTGHLAYKEKDKGQSAHQFSVIKYAHADSDEDEDHEYYGKKEKDNEFWEEFHEVALFMLLTLVFLHIAGALVSSKLHNENLVNAMITGKKEKRA